MTEQPGTKLYIDATRGMAEYISAQRIQYALENDDDNQPDDQYIQGRHALMNQHLVHHDLKKQGADQREQLQHERNHQHFKQELAVLDHAWNKPGEIELGERASHAGTTGEQEEFSAPVRAERFQRLDDRNRPRSTRQLLVQYPITIGLRQHDDAKVRAVASHDGKRRQG